MVFSTETGGSLELVEPMTSVAFDKEKEVFQAAYDSTRESASLTVVTVVATVLDRNTVGLPPLESIIDTDALDQLVAGSTGPKIWHSISFRYEGFVITLASQGKVEAEPVKHTAINTAEQTEHRKTNGDR